MLYLGYKLFFSLYSCYTWVRLVRLSVCCVGLGVPLLFWRGAPLFACVLFVGGPVLSLAGPSSWWSCWLPPCVGVSAFFLKGGLSWLLLFLFSRLLLLVLLCLVWCRPCLGVLAPLLFLSLSAGVVLLLVGFVVRLLPLCLRWLRCCARLVLRVLLFPCVLVVVGLLPRSSVRCLLLLLLLWVIAWLLRWLCLKLLSSVLCVPKAVFFCSFLRVGVVVGCFCLSLSRERRPL